MATNFPTSLDNLTNPAGSDPVNNPSHATQHANINDAIENLETKVGVNNSTVTTSLDYRVTQLEATPVASYTDEHARDAIALALRASGGITVSSDDIANTITVSTDNTIATKTYVDTAVTNLGNTSATLYVPVSEVGQADGIATLDATGKVPLTQLGNLIDGAPAALDTLNELAAAINDDASYAAGITTALGNKVSKAGGDIITSSLASTIPLALKGALSQTANLQEWQNSAGTVLSFIRSDGYARLDQGLQFGTMYSYTGAWSVDGGNSFKITNSSGSYSPLTVKGAASQTANLQEWQNSAGTVLANVSSSGQFLTPRLTITNGGNIVDSAGTTPYFGFGSNQISLLTRNAAYKGLVIQGSASQTANLQEWQASDGTIRAAVDANGFIVAGAGSAISNAVISARPFGASQVGIAVRGAASQTANLQEWQNSAGTVLSKIDSTGAMFTTTAAANTNTTQVATTAYVQTELADLVNSAPATLDTLKELSDSLGADANFATTVTNNLALRAPLASPALTGTPTAPTAAVGTDSTQVATTAFVIDQIGASTQPGALYQTSAPSSPAVGQIWIDSDENVTTFDSNIIRRKAITATAGQTVFTADLPFIDGFEQIFMNGLLLVKTTDYATSGGNTVTLTSAAAASDVIEIVSVTGANSVNTYTQAEVNALLAANTSVAPLSISANTTLLAKKRYFVTSPLAAGTPTPVSFAVTNSGSGAYNIDGVSNGTITLTRGGTYTFNVNASGHPFYIQTTGNGYNSYNVYSSGVTGAGAQVGTVTFVVPSNAPSTLYYQCQYHSAMYGQINIIDATSSALTLTLPASPALNDEIQIVDASGNSSTYNITVARNANKINGGLNNLIIDTNGGWYTLLYTGATYGWKVG